LRNNKTRKESRTNHCCDISQRLDSKFRFGCPKFIFTQPGPTADFIRFQIDDDRAFDLALVENIQRQSLNAMEEAKAFRVLSERGMTQAAVGKLIANPALQV